MKLYATITSERASQGKALGGQEWLHIDVKDESEDVIGAIHITYNGEKTILDVVYDPYLLFLTSETKGEKQKGALCGYCYKREANKGDTLCEPCAKRNAQ